MTEPILIYKTLTGSRIYNLHTQDSDYDWRMIQLSPLKAIVSPFRDPNTTHKVNEDKDDTTWELRHFVKQAIKGNPSILEVVYSPVRFVGIEHPVASELISHRRKLLDSQAIFDAHLGYATSQLKRIQCASSVIGGGQPTNYTVDKITRKRKAIVAYFRILLQGAMLLKTGEFDTWLDGKERDFLFAIKTGDVELTDTQFENSRQSYERVIKEAYFCDRYNFRPDINWAENFLESAYVNFGTSSKR